MTKQEVLICPKTTDVECKYHDFCATEEWATRNNDSERPGTPMARDIEALPPIVRERVLSGQRWCSDNVILALTSAAEANPEYSPDCQSLVTHIIAARRLFHDTTSSPAS